MRSNQATLTTATVSDGRSRAGCRPTAGISATGAIVIPTIASATGRNSGRATRGGRWKWLLKMNVWTVKIVVITRSYEGRSGSRRRIERQGVIGSGQGRRLFAARRGLALSSTCIA